MKNRLRDRFRLTHDFAVICLRRIQQKIVPGRRRINHDNAVPGVLHRARERLKHRLSVQETSNLPRPGTASSGLRRWSP